MEGRNKGLKEEMKDGRKDEKRGKKIGWVGRKEKRMEEGKKDGKKKLPIPSSHHPPLPQNSNLFQKYNCSHTVGKLPDLTHSRSSLRGQSFQNIQEK